MKVINHINGGGSIVEILKNATGKQPLFIGKPEPAMIELSIKKTVLQRRYSFLNR